MLLSAPSDAPSTMARLCAGLKGPQKSARPTEIRPRILGPNTAASKGAHREGSHDSTLSGLVRQIARPILRLVAVREWLYKGATPSLSSRLQRQRALDASVCVSPRGAPCPTPTNRTNPYLP